MLDLLGVDSLAALLAVAAGAVLAVWGLIFKARRDGAKDKERQDAEDAARRLEQGRAAVRDGRGLDPAERLRRNDGRW